MYYTMLDPTGSVEVQVLDFNNTTLDRLEHEGFIFFEVDNDGKKRQVRRDEIVEPEPIEISDKPLPVITYQMWQDVMTPLRALMAETMQPATALMPLSIRGGINNNYSDFIAALDNIEDVFSKYGF